MAPQNKKVKCIEKMLNLLPLAFIPSIVMCILGIIFIVYLPYEVSIYEHGVSYEDCISNSNNNGNVITCREYISKPHRKPCACFIEINITQALEGKVIISYELEDFDQQRSEYVNSRDDQQLMGILSPTPSVNCEPYRYLNTPQGLKPIAPCGAIADSMFNDTFEIRPIDDVNSTLNIIMLDKGFLSDADKTGYRNPNDSGDLKTYLEMRNFTRPGNYSDIEKSYDIWNWNQYSTVWDPSNSGFQNERFISWMHTDWKRKPWALINGIIPKGMYKIKIVYKYPTSRYDGRRTVILSNTKEFFYHSIYNLGVALLVIGSILLIGSIAVYTMYRISNKNGAVLTEKTEENVTNNLPPEVRPLAEPASANA